MDTKLMVVKKVLDALDVPFDITSMEHRKDIQKAVFLAQEVGVPSGYDFSWYVRGPYSPTLTKGYYDANVAELFAVADSKTLRDELQESLRFLRSQLAEKAPTGLSRSDWLELAASWSFLRHKRGQSAVEAEDVIRSQKPRLVEGVGRAEDFYAAVRQHPR